MPFGRLEQRARPAPMSDINMTPLIDVMLVLLVIFIVAAPLMASSLRLDLPRAEGAQPSQAKDALRVAIDAEGRVFLGDETLAPADVERRLVEQARAAAQRNPATEVHLRADARVPYGRVAEVIGLLQQAGLSRIGFVTEAAGR
jgi:biopolymer transport protein ExbD/biopolymer transport protein TolR